MKKLSWNNITIRQFQEATNINKSEDLDDVEKVESTIAILYNLTQDEIDNLPIPTFKKYSEDCVKFMNSPVPGKAVREFKLNGRKYKIVYKVNELSYGTYQEINKFSEDYIGNLHFLTASIVTPVNWYGKKIKLSHKEISVEMREAKVIHVYHACVFFCKLFSHLIENIKPSLIYEAKVMGINERKLEDLLNNSKRILDGSIAHEKWLPLQVSR